MIYSLRKKFIKICTISFLLVFLLILALIFGNSTLQVNHMVDSLTDMIAENGGMMLDPTQQPQPDDRKEKPDKPDFLNDETRFSTRYFTVEVDESGNVVSTEMDNISSVSAEEAEEYTAVVLKKGEERGWISDYRYKVTTDDSGSSVVFVNGSMFRSMSKSMIFSTASTFLGCSLAVLLLIILISKKAVKPAAESYEKQKQFITDVNHELKTPLTLILTNTEIAESELGQNEWLDDIRCEGERMSTLVNKLVILSRMDEDNQHKTIEPFSLSGAIEDTVSEFRAAIKQQQKNITVDIAASVKYSGNEQEIRQLLAILLDNAVKYCDPEGAIYVALKAGRHPVILVQNTYQAVSEIPLNRLFDRFFRADKARTAGSGYGIGLSIAKSITERHGGEIKAYSIKETDICFHIKL